ncbi:MAG: T9SS type A sorting domain-containing protein, partial [Bacteroidota bacterium]
KVLIDVKTPYSSLIVFSVLGEQLYEQTNADYSLHEITFELQLRPGIYFMVLNSTTSIQSVPFIVQ